MTPKIRTAKIVSPSRLLPCDLLEDELQRELNVARFVDGGGYLTERIADVIAGRSQADHIECVQEVAAELKVSTFRDSEILRQSEVNLLIAGSALRAHSGIPEARGALFAIGTFAIVGAASAGHYRRVRSKPVGLRPINHFQSTKMIRTGC